LPRKWWSVSGVGDGMEDPPDYLPERHRVLEVEVPAEAWRELCRRAGELSLQTGHEIDEEDILRELADLYASDPRLAAKVTKRLQRRWSSGGNEQW
jgi:hypothetical protein